ncbi:MAG: hypothetical protein HQM12_01030 [SAR324 cluster bacterium]|nr:hypothetical protein [SAR324 cluster bacterium]
MISIESSINDYCSPYSINDWLRFVQQQDDYWKQYAANVYKDTLNLLDPRILQVNHLREAFQYYIIPVLKKLLQQPENSSIEFFKSVPIFASKLRFFDFLAHFYDISPYPDSARIHIKDRYLRESYMLYDLFKAKNTIAQTDLLLKLIAQYEYPFPSRFSRSQQIQILKGIKGALLMTFRETIIPEHQRFVIDHLDLNWFTAKEMEQRKKNGIQYCIPQQTEGSRYRRIFLHILFREKIRTHIKGKITEIQYSLLQFEDLKREYFKDWMLKLEKHPVKQQAYQQHLWKNKNFTEWLIENPENESILLEQLPVDSFNDMLAFVTENISKTEQPLLIPESDKFGPLKLLNQNLKELSEKYGSNQVSPEKILELKHILKSMVEYSKLEGQEQIWEYDIHKQKIPFKRHVVSYIPTIRSVTSRIIILINAQDLADYKDSIAALMQRMELRDWILSTPESIDPLLIQKAGVVLLFRCSPDFSSFRISSGPFPEIINIESPLNIYALSVNEGAQSNIYLKRYHMLQTSLMSEPQDILNVVKTCQDLFELNSLRQELITKTAFDSQKILLLSENYHQLLYWLLLEGMEDVYHKRILLKSLVQVLRCQIIGDPDYGFNNFLQSRKFSSHLLASWSYEDFNHRITQIYPGETITQRHVSLFMKDYNFENYDVILFVDWKNSVPGNIPVYLNIRAQGTFYSCYQLNLQTIFEAPYPFLERARKYMMELYAENLHKLESNHLHSLFSYWKSTEMIKIQMNQIDYRIAELKEQQRQQQEISHIYSPRQLIQSHILDRLEYFICGYLAEQ